MMPGMSLNGAAEDNWQQKQDNTIPHRVLLHPGHPGVFNIQYRGNRAIGQSGIQKTDCQCQLCAACQKSNARCQGTGPGAVT